MLRVRSRWRQEHGERLAKVEQIQETEIARQERIEEEVAAIRLTWWRVFIGVAWLVSIAAAVLAGINFP